MKVSGYMFTNTQVNQDFTCDKIIYNDESTIDVSPSFSLNKPHDLKFLRNQLMDLRVDNKLYDLFFQDKEDETEDNILARKWWKFCGSAVWLEKYGVYFMVNRIAYSSTATRSNPTISVLAGQVFDENWKEIIGMKFPFSDLVFPTILPHYVDEGVNARKVILGSEDPRVILHEYVNDKGITIQEPLIVFNSLSTEVNWKRAMHIYRPLYDPHRTIRLSIENLEPREKEKNWAPFTDGNGHINFIYNFPLRILQCDLDTGKCQKISGPDFNEDANKNAGELRGGTNLIQIPSQYVPKELRNNKFWFGIARSHINHCGCVKELYRPHAIIISRDVKNKEDYKLVYVSNLLDFNMNPEPWTPGKTTCSDGKSVLIPNSLAYFSNDYLGVTFSEADRTNKLVHTKGWLAYIQKILAELKTSSEDNSDIDSSERDRMLSVCSTFLSSQYCEVAKESMGWDKLES
ncbi:BMT3 Beta-mannosyltransferase 3 [Candida maltosa Xu316]